MAALSPLAFISLCGHGEDVIHHVIRLLRLLAEVEGITIGLTKQHARIVNLVIASVTFMAGLIAVAILFAASIGLFINYAAKLVAANHARFAPTVGDSMCIQIRRSTLEILMRSCAVEDEWWRSMCRFWSCKWVILAAWNVQRWHAA